METTALSSARETTFPIAPAVTLKVRVILHPSLKALRDEWEETQGYRCNEVLAFCNYDETGPVDDLVCSLHFQPDNFKIPTIAHEVWHAVLLLGHYLRLDLDNKPAEEILAEAMEHIMLHVLKFKRESKASKRR